MGGSNNRELAALLFMTSAMTTLDAYSTLNSSPWTAENFGADPEKAASCKEYVTHAVVFSMVYAFASAYIAKNWWPLLGAFVANMYLVWLYSRALNRGAAAGSAQWANQKQAA
jgi:accessory gene regulator protein AgrB